MARQHGRAACAARTAPIGPSGDRRIDHVHPPPRSSEPRKSDCCAVDGEPVGDRLAQVVAELGHTAAEHDDSGSNVSVSSSTARLRPPITASHSRRAPASPADGGASRRGSGRAGLGRPHPLDRRARGDRLDAADLAAGAAADRAGSIGMWPISPATSELPRAQLTAFDVAGGDARADAEVGEVGDGTDCVVRTSRRRAPRRARRSRRARRRRARR